MPPALLHYGWAVSHNSSGKGAGQVPLPRNEAERCTPTLKSDHGPSQRTLSPTWWELSLRAG